MQIRALAVVLCAQLLQPAVAVKFAAKGNMIQNVLDLLDGLEKKVTEQQKIEVDMNEEKERLCANTKAALETSIKENTELIAELQLKMDETSRRDANLQTGIQADSTALGKMDQDGRRAGQLAGTRHGLFQTKQNELTETIKALGDAIQGLEASQTGLLQTNQQLLLDQARLLLGKYDMSAPPIKAAGDKDAHTDRLNSAARRNPYQLVLEEMKRLKSKMEKELEEVVAGETNAQNADNLAQQALNAQIAATGKARDNKGAEQKAAQAAYGSAKTDLGTAQVNLGEDQDALATTTQNCASDAKQHQQRNKAMTDEKTAIDVARNILSKASGVKEKYVASPTGPERPDTAKGVVEDLLQAASPAKMPAFLQITGLKSHKTTDNTVFLDVDDPRLQAVQLLRTEAKAAHSKALAKLADEVCMHLGGIFNDVNNMIEKMIFQLQKEQTNENNNKAWCDEEVATTRNEIAEKDGKKKDLAANIGSLTAKINALNEKIGEEENKKLEFNKYLEDYKAQRATSKAHNADALKDAEEGLTAINEALEVLNQYYKTFEVAKGDDYTGVSVNDDGKNPVVAALEKMSNDFATLKGDIQNDEAASVTEYKEEVSKFTVALSGVDSSIKVTTTERDEANANNDKAKQQQRENDKALADVEQYLKDLEPACGNHQTPADTVAATKEYMGRKQDRADEINALNKAKGILKDAFKKKPSFLQRQHKPTSGVPLSKACDA